THANQWNLSVGLAKEIALNEATTLRPFGQLHYTNVAIDGYREKGGAPALLYKDNTIDSLVSEIGLAAERKLNNGWSVNGSLAWEHEFSNDSRSIRTAFVADPANTVFRVKGVDGQRDYGRVAVGVSKEIDRDRSFFVNLDGVVGNSDYRDYTLEFKYRQSF
ncbi:MAG TPA: autotransporter outer membrane beta-barrel domain-containing protein, partial [Azonexus sp.]|nr:autotransporter outer membrane beta-barrel domain-containing protein [Azonexus sp.]